MPFCLPAPYIRAMAWRNAFVSAASQRGKTFEPHQYIKGWQFIPHGHAQVPSLLTSLENALRLSLESIQPVAVSSVSLDEALGLVSAELAASSALPEKSLAVMDGWAVSASDCIGASSYSPVLLPKRPLWVENGQPLPDGCDSVIESDWLDLTTAAPQIVSEPRPGQGVRRAGEDIASGMSILSPGQSINQLALLVAARLGLQTLSVRQPRLRLIDIPSDDGVSSTTKYIIDVAVKAGARVTRTHARQRSAQAIAEALESGDADLMVTIGGTGEGKTDATAEALRVGNGLLAHGIAIAPGRTAAIGKLRHIPVVCLPGALEDALAAWWTLVLPILDRLTDRKRRNETRPLTRKIASAPGVADIVLLARDQDNWLPLSVGTLPLRALMQAEAWTVVPGHSEGLASGTPCVAYRFEDGV
jgi:molybdopterin molybdotransferase